jgi:hypothetical protein
MIQLTLEEGGDDGPVNLTTPPLPVTASYKSVMVFPPKQFQENPQPE